MQTPKMILFDYGHTLLCEPGLDFLQGEHALMPYITTNRYNLTPEQIHSFANELYIRTVEKIRTIGLDLHERQFQRMVYDYLGIGFSISPEEAELVQWDAASSGALMPEADQILDYVNENGIRSGVISNIGWSGHALQNRFDRLLPRHQFEFIIASSEYGFRKPNPYLFELALRKAGLAPNDVWFCGDNPQADIEGAAKVGMFPVWYDNDTECGYNEHAKKAPPRCEHLHIKDWHELIQLLNRLKHGE